MSCRDDELELDLERLRLASDFTEISRSTPNPLLRAHCMVMASFWTEQAERSCVSETMSADSLELQDG